MQTINKWVEKKAIAVFVFLTYCIFAASTQAQSQDEQAQQLQLASVQLNAIESEPPIISMDFKDASLKDVLKIFSQQAGMNFVASEEIKDRKVTLYLDKVSVDDALNSILSANHLTYEQKEESNIFVVKELKVPMEEVVTVIKTFPLQYARVSASGDSSKSSQPATIKDIIAQLLSQHGRVMEDTRTNSLIVSDVPTQFSKIEKTIEELDIKLSQVMIEAEIIETNLDTIDKLGIAWGSSTDGELASAFGASRRLRYPFTADGGNPLVGLSGDQSGLYMGYISANNLGGVLDMLARDTDTKVLARPRIMALNNETAEIKITADTAIASLTETSSAEGIATQTISAERTETGVTLKVTPHVNKYGEITMLIEPSVTNTVASRYFDDFVDPQTRSAKTTVLIRDRETIVIGVFLNTEDSDTLRKVPFLGDIPLLGNIFRHQDKSSTDKEVIIFITPHLLKGEKKELALEKTGAYRYRSSSLREEAIESVLDQFEK